MAADLALLVVTPGMRPGHLVALLRNCPDSPFFDHDDEDLKALNDAAVLVATYDGLRSDAVFAEGPLIGRSIGSVPVNVQAMALSHRLLVARGDQTQALTDSDNGAFDLLFNPTAVGGHLRSSVLDAIEQVGGDVYAAREFLVAHHGMTAVLILD
jgi:hypothetical protein